MHDTVEAGSAAIARIKPGLYRPIELLLALAGLVIEAKRLALADEQPARIVEMIERKLSETESNKAASAQ